MLSWPGAIAMGDEAADDAFKFSNPVISWRIHFNCSRDCSGVCTGAPDPYWGKSRDTRKEYYEQQKKRAIEQLKNGEPCFEVMQTYGFGLHALQDIGAHMDLTTLEHNDISVEGVEGPNFHIDNIEYTRGSPLAGGRATRSLPVPFDVSWMKYDAWELIVGTYCMRVPMPLARMWQWTHSRQRVRETERDSRIAVHQFLCDVLQNDPSNRCVSHVPNSPKKDHCF